MGIRLKSNFRFIFKTINIKNNGIKNCLFFIKLIFNYI